MNAFDEWLLQQLNVNHQLLLQYGCLVDDRLMITHKSMGGNILDVMNNWHPSIKFDLVHQSEHANFLDLALTLQTSTSTSTVSFSQRLVYETYHKPLNAYLYLPRQS